MRFHALSSLFLCSRHNVQCDGRVQLYLILKTIEMISGLIWALACGLVVEIGFLHFNYSGSNIEGNGTLEI